MATREHRETHNVEQTEKMIPFVTRKTSFGWSVGGLVFGVTISDLDRGFQNDPVEQPIKRNSVGSGHECVFVVYVIHISQPINLVFLVNWCLGLGIGPCTGFPDAIVVGFDRVV